MLPPKERMCHRACFEKSCRDLVTSEACARWGTLSWEDKHGTKRVEYMCADDMQTGLLSHLQQKLNSVVGTIDQMRKEEKNRGEVALATNAQVLGTMMDAAQRLAVVTDAVSDLRAIEQHEEQRALTFRNGQ